MSDDLEADFEHDDEGLHERWDANDPRRQRDCFAPPAQACECFCLHCHRTFMSDQIWLQRVIGGRDGFDGSWMCPTPNCGGAGFTFDIFPTDPTHPANAGWDDGEDEFDDEDESLATFDESDEWNEDDDPTATDVDAPDYDPAEPKYAQMDSDLLDSGDLEGEEWKHGREPTAAFTAPDASDGSCNIDEIEDERRYDMPDERPRELDWTHRKDEWVGDDELPF